MTAPKVITITFRNGAVLQWGAKDIKSIHGVDHLRKRAKTTAAAKAKSRRLQSKARDLAIQYLGVNPADIKTAIMGESGEDIKLAEAARKVLPYAIECKNTEKLNVWEAWGQCKGNADKAKLTPLLVIARNEQEPLAVLFLTDLYILQREANGKP